MSPAFVKMLTRLFSAGLCCLALCSAPLMATENPTTQAPHTLESDATPAASAPATAPTATSPVVSESQSTANAAKASPPASSLTAPAPAPVGSSRHLLSVTLALMGIIALIFALSWFAKRFAQVGFNHQQTFKVIASMPLGTRERLLLVEVAGQQLLLGITANSINTLHCFDEPIQLPQGQGAGSEFSRKLMAILQQKNPLAASEQNNNDTSAR